MQFLPYREHHNHRAQWRFSPPPLPPSTSPTYTADLAARNAAFRQRFQHVALLRLGLVGAPRQFYRDLCPAEGFTAAAFPEWLSLPLVTAAYAKGKGENWGQKNCYGQSSAKIDVSSNWHFLSNHSTIYNSMVGVSFTEAADALVAAKTTLLSGKQNLSNILFLGAFPFSLLPVLDAFLTSS